MKAMPTLKAVIFGAILMGSAALAVAGGLSRKYKNWDKSPEAYFLTSGEKTSWKKVQTDAEAQNFILDYKARRGPDFEKMLADRIAAADKYFSAGETKGSETLRGKVIILFGPPSGVDSSLSSKKSEVTANSGAPPEIGVGGRNGSLALSSGGAGPTGTAPRHVDSPTFTLQYDAQAAPKAIGKAFNVELKLISNATQESWDQKGLDAKFEAVALASIVPEGGAAKVEPPVDKK